MNIRQVDFVWQVDGASCGLPGKLSAPLYARNGSLDVLDPDFFLLNMWSLEEVILLFLRSDLENQLKAAL